MPCMKCSNGKYKYGKKGNCQFDTLAACRAAEAAIHAREQAKKAVLMEMLSQKKEFHNAP